jgi:hypothetical protein
MVKVPTEVGVPLRVMVLVLLSRAALSPGGRPLAVRLLYGFRPLRTGSVPT